MVEGVDGEAEAADGALAEASFALGGAAQGQCALVHALCVQAQHALGAQLVGQQLHLRGGREPRPTTRDDARKGMPHEA